MIKVNYSASVKKRLKNTLLCLGLVAFSLVQAQEKSPVAAASDAAALQLLHADYQPLLDSVATLVKKTGFAHITAENVLQMRMADAVKVQPPLATPAVAKKVIKGSSGQPDVTLYVINATAGSNKPALLYMHGGGYVLGSPDLVIPGMQRLAEKHHCTVVVVQYRLAPETPFPGALEDNYAALNYMYQNSEQLGIDKNRIVIMGHSAGGGHAAMLAIAARDRGEIPVKQQILIFPMLDDRTGSSRDVPEHIGQLLWSRTSNQFGWSALLGQQAGMAEAPYGAVPARVKDLSHLPPTQIIVGAIDLFVEENIDYAKRLIQAGVATELHVLPGIFHASETIYPEAEVSKQFTELENKAIHQALWQ